MSFNLILISIFSSLLSSSLVLFIYHFIKIHSMRYKIMIIKNIRIVDKDFNGVPYKEFSIYVLDNRMQRIYQTTGKTNCVYVDQDGTVLDELRLDKAVLNPGDQISLWFDQSNKIAQIDVLVHDNSYVSVPF